MGQSKNEKMTLWWKPEKGSLERKQKFFEDSRAKRTEEWKATTGQHLKHLWGLLPFSENQKFEPCVQEFLA